MVSETIRVDDGFFKMLRPDSADDLISEDDFVGDERLPLLGGDLAVVDRSRRRKSPAGEIAAATGPKRTIEIGCGVGVVTTAAMKAGLDVLATDYYEPALEFVRANTCRNLET